jgi:hypothetical protein
LSQKELIADVEKSDEFLGNMNPLLSCRKLKNLKGWKAKERINIWVRY